MIKKKLELQVGDLESFLFFFALKANFPLCTPLILEKFNGFIKMLLVLVVDFDSFKFLKKILENDNEKCTEYNIFSYLSLNF